MDFSLANFDNSLDSLISNHLTKKIELKNRLYEMHIYYRIDFQKVPIDDLLTTDTSMLRVFCRLDIAS